MDVVYTCIASSGEGEISDSVDRILSAEPQLLPDTRYVVYTDRFQSGRWPAGNGVIWTVYPLMHMDATPRRTARWHKLNSHQLFPNAARVLWFDGCLVPKQHVSFAPLFDLVTDTIPVASFQHPVRNCVYEELAACIRLHKDDPDVMTDQVHRYRDFLNYPANNGLAETACVVRKHGEAVTQFNRQWWHQVNQGSHRDQLSFNLSLWLQDLPWAIVPGCRDESPYFRYYSHRAPRQKGPPRFRSPRY